MRSLGQATAAILFATALFCDAASAKTLSVGSQNFMGQFMLDGHFPSARILKGTKPLTYRFSVRASICSS
jgi:hypothetical protein